MRATRSLRWSALSSALVSAAHATAAFAACPQIPCDCLGASGRFDVVATESVVMRPAKLLVEGDAFPWGSSAGAVCTPTASLVGSATGYGYGELFVDTVVGVAGSGQAVRADSFGSGSGPAVFVNLLVTGGGTFSGTSEADVEQLDTSGTHPLVSTCTQAIADAQSGSQTLAGLTATLDYGNIVLRGDQQLTINAGPGVTVIEANKIVLRPIRYYGYYLIAPTLEITTVPETEAVIVNTRRLALGAASQILSDGERTIVNVPGPGPSVRFGRYVRTSVPVLAPQRVLRAAGSYDLDLASLYAKRLRLRGSSVPSYLRTCPPSSPSGAFLDAEVSFLSS